jgi:hypothetical protein
VLALVTPMGPGGLRVEAIHRVVPDLSLDEAPPAAAGLPGHGAAPPATPAGRGAPASGWPTPDESGFLVTDGHPAGAADRAPPPRSWRRAPEAPAGLAGLDVVLAHHGLLDHLWHRGDDPESVLVAHDVDEALRLAAERAGVALLLRAPSPADVAAVARAGARMPRKSTLFVPEAADRPGAAPARRTDRPAGGSRRPARRRRRTAGTLRPLRQLTSHTDAVPVPVRQNRRCSAPSTSTTSPGCHSAARRCSARS